MLTNRKPGTPDSENQLNLFPIFNGNMMMGISTRLLRSIMRFNDDCSIEVVRLYWIAIEVLTDETVFATKTARGKLVIPAYDEIKKMKSLAIRTHVCLTEAALLLPNLLFLLLHFLCNHHQRHQHQRHQYQHHQLIIS